jgi:hypothetical protein
MTPLKVSNTATISAARMSLMGRQRQFEPMTSSRSAIA